MSPTGHWTWLDPCCSAVFPTCLRISRSGIVTLWAAWGTSPSTANPSTWLASSLTTAPRKVRRHKFSQLQPRRPSWWASVPVHANVCFCLSCSGCPAKKNFCTNDVCQNGGVCVSKWNTYSCDCPTGYGGKNCEQGRRKKQKTHKYTENRPEPG